MSKFFVEQNQIENETIYIYGEDVNHIVNVLRLKKNERILICDKDNSTTYLSKIIETDKNRVVCKIEEKIENTTESSIDITIFQGLPKGEKMEYIIQKTTELGVKIIVPVEMKRSVVRLKEKDATRKIERWRKIAEVAAKQSERDSIPAVSNICVLADVVEQIKEFDLFIVAYEQEKDFTLKQELKRIKNIGTKKNKIGVLIGPEGGIDEKEIEVLKNNGARIITLGKRILRTETAPIVIMSNIIYEYEL